MSELEQEKILVFTPSRKIRGKRIVCHDDRYIVRLAAETDGVIVSNDNYRDLVAESQDFRKAIEERLLMYSFVNDRLLFIYLFFYVFAYSMWHRHYFFRLSVRLSVRPLTPSSHVFYLVDGFQWNLPQIFITCVELPKRFSR